MRVDPRLDALQHAQDSETIRGQLIGDAGRFVVDAGDETSLRKSRGSVLKYPVVQPAGYAAAQFTRTQRFLLQGSQKRQLPGSAEPLDDCSNLTWISQRLRISPSGERSIGAPVMHKDACRFRRRTGLVIGIIEKLLESCCRLRSFLLLRALLPGR